jgi:hypothetical protein
MSPGGVPTIGEATGDDGEQEMLQSFSSQLIIEPP